MTTLKIAARLSLDVSPVSSRPSANSARPEVALPISAKRIVYRLRQMPTEQRHNDADHRRDDQRLADRAQHGVPDHGQSLIAAPSGALARLQQSKGHRQ